MSRELGFVDFTCNRGGDNGRGILIPDIVLHDPHGTDSALFAPHDGG